MSSGTGETINDLYEQVDTLMAENDYAGVDAYLDEATVQADTALGIPSEQLLHVYHARGEAYMRQAALPGLGQAQRGLFILKAQQLAMHLCDLADGADITPGEQDPGVLAEILGNSLLGRVLTLEAAMTPQVVYRQALGMEARAAFIRAFGATLLGTRGGEAATYGVEVSSAAARLEGLLGLSPHNEERWRHDTAFRIGQLAVAAASDRDSFAPRVLQNVRARAFVAGNPISARTSILARP